MAGVACQAATRTGFPRSGTRTCAPSTFLFRAGEHSVAGWPRVDVSAPCGRASRWPPSWGDHGDRGSERPRAGVSCGRRCHLLWVNTEGLDCHTTGQERVQFSKKVLFRT